MMNVLITLGPTREYIDPVRFISNESSGKMGIAIAKEALKRKHKVKIIHGKISIPISECLPDVQCYEITNAEELKNKAIEEAKNCEIFICAAAISDFTVDRSETKIKSGGELTLKLKPAVKVTRLIKESFPEIFVAAFKAEYNVSAEELCASARNKLVSENLDLVVANDVMKNRFGGDETEIFIVDGKEIFHMDKGSKEKAAFFIFDFIEKKIKKNKI